MKNLLQKWLGITKLTKNYKELNERYTIQERILDANREAIGKAINMYEGGGGLYIIINGKPHKINGYQE